jgi:hypothetical protein
MTGILKRKFTISAGLLALLCALVCPTVRADGAGLGDLTISLPTISGMAGQQFTVFGTLTNSSSSPLYFSSDSAIFNNLAIQGSPDVAFNGFLGLLLGMNLGPTSINANSTLTGVDLFTVFIPTGTAPGMYNTNSYDLQGGVDPTCTLGFCEVQLGTVEFSVNVQAPVTTPEPGTLLLLLASGLLSGLLVIRRAAQ